jgi:hypothetical protein
MSVLTVCQTTWYLVEYLISLTTQILTLCIQQLLVLQVLINAHLHYFNVFFMRLHAHRKTQVLLAIVLSVLLLLAIVFSRENQERHCYRYLSHSHH